MKVNFRAKHNSHSKKLVHFGPELKIKMILDRYQTTSLLLYPTGHVSTLAAISRGKKFVAPQIVKTTRANEGHC